MPSLPRTTALACLLALSACATLDTSAKPTVPVPMSAVPAGAPGQNPGISGEVVWADLSQAQTTRRARFDDWMISGPSVKIGRRPDGIWTGTLLGNPVTLSPSMGNISGSNVDLSIEWHGTGTWITGSCFGAPVRFEISGVHVKGTAGANVFDLKALGPGQFGDAAGLLTLSGSAARTDAAMPQMALAMLAVLLR
jgi:hypothetical protein